MTRVSPDTVIMVVSDHGFHTVRDAFKWSGDHISTDASAVAGLLLTNRPLTTTAPRLIDVAPTVLKHFGLALPAENGGQPLF